MRFPYQIHDLAPKPYTLGSFAVRTAAKRLNRLRSAINWRPDGYFISNYHKPCKK